MSRTQEFGNGCLLRALNDAADAASDYDHPFGIGDYFKCAPSCDLWGELVTHNRLGENGEWYESHTTYTYDSCAKQD